ncbi:hypothetical protein DERP_003428 [Dermatophagoides pteronyssinus]|uniref:beta-mannosidase n=1 Tax=Dermatophagoides pteronyssinus TaxID=6956 RepID=A0ABQ8JJY8_DERPT|nr:hypothetical protein DERP_003428 [Dermatophagoides pteronyssinus]
MKHTTIIITIIIIKLFVIINAASTAVIIHSLDGNDWNVFDSNKRSNSIPAKVPGTIYSDLVNAGILNELYKDFNDVKYRWVSYSNWTYSKSFDLPKKLLNYDQIYLTCHGLDTIANITLNGYQLDSVDNQFVRYRFPIKNLLKEQQNVIQIICPPESQHGECHPNFIRKMQSSFSWDWGPAFPTQGIWQSISIEAYNNVLIRTISANTVYEQQSNQWLLNATVWLESRPKSLINANLTISLADQLLIVKEFQTQFDSDGETFVNAFILIPKEMSIKPWFPNGLGDQILYRLNATIQIGNEEMSNKQIGIGFRTIELVQDRLNASVEAYSFYFRVNGVPIFAKGSNWIPAHVLNENVKPEYVQFLLWSAKVANMNMLRVWGGGIYESDYFYQLADEYGILIWQDMMFACALYPTDQKFIQSVSKEIRQQVRRLHHHPSIAIWAGNNENEMAISQMWWMELALHMNEYKRDYHQLYIDTIMPIILQEDVSRPFVSSSPSNGIVSQRENYLSTDPQNKRYGDNHHYVVFVDAWDWRLAPSSKFVSEYGFQSLPSLELLQKYLSVEYLKYPFNEGLIHREHQMNGLAYLNDFMDRHFPLQTNITVPSIEHLEDFIYMSQIFQSMAIKIQTEFYRRNRQINYHTGEGFTMGALYWQLNNIWPGFSWSSIEYEGKWKMLHYYAKRMFDDLLVDVYEDQDFLNVIIVRDDHSHVTSFTVDIEVYDWSKQEPIYTQRINCQTNPFDVTIAFKMNMNEFLQKSRCNDRDNCFINVRLNGTINGQLLQRDNFLLLGYLKNAKLAIDPKIFLQKIDGPYRRGGVHVYDIELITDKIAPFIWINIVNNSSLFSIFSDNGFHLIKQKKLQIFISEDIPKEMIRSSLQIKTINNLVRKK